MNGADIFAVYRSTLAIVVGSYAVVRTASFLWHWQLGTRRAGRRESLLRRYLVTSLLRMRIRRFWLELLQIVVLMAVLWYVVGVQIRRVAPGSASGESAGIQHTVEPTTGPEVVM